jgi:MipA family protein
MKGTTVKKHLGREHQLLFAVASALMYSGTVWAEGPGAILPSADTSGFTVLSNATNVTHWGIGGGAAFEQSPYKGYGTHITPVPVFFFDDKWIHAFGTTVDLKVGKWGGLAFTLRGNYAIADGYKGSDAPILNGMQTRSAAFWLGPAFKWQTQYGDLSGEYLTSGNKGQKADIAFGKTLDYGNFSVEPHAGVTWFSGKYVDYYYGVRSSEAQAGRPAYTGTAAYKESVGAKFDYRLTRHQLVSIDLGVAHLGSGITDSPIVGKRFIPEAKVVYLYQFK